MTHALADAPEFSRTIDVARMEEDEGRFEIAANPSEREALARRFGLLELASLTADVRVKRCAGGTVRVDIELEGDVVQACVVTLQPVASHVKEKASALFAPEAEVAVDIDLSGGAEDIPEPLADTVIDIGELTAQYFALALDPYPRAPGVRFEEYAAGPAEKDDEAAAGPFAALARLRGAYGKG
ncbi:MAG: DUF177 domain-containing protein [Alphaproteobacteria bacterium]